MNIISTTNIQQAINQIKKSVTKPIIIKAQDEKFNRRILEYGKFDVILDIHETQGRDKLKQVDSGLNHVLAKIAAKNKIAIGIDLDKIRKLEKKEKALVLGRIMQNIRICRKAKTRIKLINYRDEKDAFDFLISLGASTEQAREALS